MPITPATKPAPRKRVSIKLLLDQLDQEWEKAQPLDGPDADLLAYYHCAVRVGLHWVGGDVYTFEFPDAYQGERLAKMCGYLRTLQGADTDTIKAARERNLAGLRACWPAYRDLAYPDMPADWPHSVLDWEVPPFTWEAIETLWDGDNWVGEGDRARALFLPTFRYRESADFHLAALAVLFLNRQLRYALTDLYPHQLGDGRN